LTIIVYAVPKTKSLPHLRMASDLKKIAGLNIFYQS